MQQSIIVAIMRCELCSDGGHQCDGHHVATCNVALQFLFYFWNAYFTLHPAAKVFEAEAFTWQKECLCMRERERFSPGCVTLLIPTLLVGRSVIAQAPSGNSCTNTNSSNTSNTRNNNTNNNNTSNNNTDNNTRRRNSRTQSQKKFVAFNIKQ